VTCIAGVVAADGTVYIGGDSAGVAGWSLSVRADSKVFTLGDLAMGFTTSFRMGQVLRYSLDVPKYDGDDLERWMATTFIDAVRECLKKAGWATKDKEQESGGDFLVGLHGRLFSVHGDYQVGEDADGVAAVGCGGDIALGALWATRGLEAPKRVRTALEAAERFSAGVRGPFTIVSTTRVRT
jgi:ATP-dependent protease HslVU (ClpYQ) peptidase subunit